MYYGYGTNLIEIENLFGRTNENPETEMDITGGLIDIKCRVNVCIFCA